jgi:hypothetical protein
MFRDGNHFQHARGARLSSPWSYLGNGPAGHRYPKPEATALVGSARMLVNLI